MTIPNLDRGPSWIGSDARKRSPHLWISDSVNGDVDIFTMPKLKLTGTLKGFKEPQGLCTDKQSNVWIVATADRKIYEYSRSGKNLLKTIKDNSGYPASCAINQRNGDLAITNIISSDNPYEPGNLMIYKGAHRYTHNVHAREPVRIFVGYDPNGNLFLDGCVTALCLDGGTFQLAELPKDGTLPRPIVITGGTIYFSGFVEWYSKGDDLLVGDQACGGVITTCAYQIDVSGSVGTIEESTPFRNSDGGPVCNVASAVLNKSETSLLGGDAEFSTSQCPSYTASGTYVWKFPTGGNPVYGNLTARQKYPAGAAITY